MRKFPRSRFQDFESSEMEPPCSGDKLRGKGRRFVSFGFHFHSHHCRYPIRLKRKCGEVQNKVRLEIPSNYLTSLRAEGSFLPSRYATKERFSDTSYLAYSISLISMTSFGIRYLGISCAAEFSYCLWKCRLFPDYGRL